MKNKFETNPVQALLDAWSKHNQEARAESQMTLGGLIEFLEGVGEANVIEGLGHLHSYRGYYCDLAFEPTSEMRAVRDLLDECQRAMGRRFDGYKGGLYLMGESTPLWVSNYGESSGMRLMEIGHEGSVFVPVTKQEDDYP